MDHESFINEVCRRAGLADREQAARATEATLSALGERLLDMDVQAVAERLPRRLAHALQGDGHHADLSLGELYDRVSRREGVSLGFAIEHAQVVCRVLAEAVDGEGLAHLTRHLPSDWANLFALPEAEGHVDQPPRSQAGAPTTLASGRPGSLHPLSEAAPPAGQFHSVVRSENPHADRKLSSAGGRPLDPIADARPGSETPLAEGRDRPKPR